MECERLKRLVKNWYLQVQDEVLAPARMVSFMNAHVEDCLVCLGDPGVELEIKKITEIVLPPSKIPKALRREEAEKAGVAQDENGPVGPVEPVEGGALSGEGDNEGEDGR